MTTEGLRQALLRVYRWVVSTRVALWLLISWVALVLVWVLPFILSGLKEDTVSAIATHWLPFRIIYATVAVVSLVCALHRFLRDRSRDWDRALRSRFEGAKDDAAHFGTSLDDAKESLLANGFSVVSEDEGAVTLARHRLSVYGGAVFHAGIAMVAVALAVNAATISSVTFDLIEGQTIADSFKKAGSPEAKAALYRPVQNLRLEGITPKFFGPYLLFERLDATLLDSGRRRNMSLAYPLWVDPMTNLSIQDFDVAPRFVVHSQEGAIAEDTTVAMDLFPPGSDRSVRLYTAKADLTLRLYTDFAVRDNRPVSSSYNLQDMKMLVTAVAKVAGVPDRIVTRRIMSVGDTLIVNDFKVEIAEIKTVGTFRVTRAPALPFVVLSIVLAIAGLATRLLLRRVDVLLVSDGEGTFFVAVEDVFGKAAGEAKIERMLTSGGDRK